MALHLCRETFTGELAPGLAKTFHAGVDILDDSDKEEAALLHKFGLYFSEAVSTHIKPEPTEAEVAATKKSAKAKRTRAAKAKAAAVPAAKAPAVKPAETPVKPAPAPVRTFGLSNVTGTNEMEENS